MCAGLCPVSLRTPWVNPCKTLQTSLTLVSRIRPPAKPLPHLPRQSHRSRRRVAEPQDKERIWTCRALIPCSLTSVARLDAPGVHWLTRFHRLYPHVGLEVAPERIKEAFYWADAQLLAHPEITTLQFLPLMLEHAALQLRYLALPAHPYQQQLAAGFCDAARRRSPGQCRRPDRPAPAVYAWRDLEFLWQRYDPLPGMWPGGPV